MQLKIFKRSSESCRYPPEFRIGYSLMERDKCLLENTEIKWRLLCQMGGSPSSFHLSTDCEAYIIQTGVGVVSEKTNQLGWKRGPSELTVNGLPLRWPGPHLITQEMHTQKCGHFRITEMWLDNQGSLDDTGNTKDRAPPLTNTHFSSWSNQMAWRTSCHLPWATICQKEWLQVFVAKFTLPFQQMFVRQRKSAWC